MTLLTFSLLLLGCTDNSVGTFNADPTVSILEPLEGTEVAEGEPVTFVGLIDDDSSGENLLVEWSSSIDGLLVDTDPPTPDGYVELSTASLSDGVHVITLRATDSDAAQGEDEVSITVIDVPDLPTIEILYPAEGDASIDGNPYIFMANVSDNQDPPEDLLVSLSSTPGGFVCYLTLDGAGNAQCAESLPIGSYLLEFMATDTDENTVTALVNYSVVEEGDFDADGDGFSPNGGDCNDANNTIYPGAPELCDGLDNDCNKATAIDVGTECYDDDGDAFCEVPPCVNTAETLSDCDDTNASVSPNGSELPNGADDDCDGTIDEGTSNYDDDGDGFCETPPCVNAKGKLSDCDDTDYTVNPSVTEVCDDGLDNNCDGALNEQNAINCTNFYYDGDSDAYGIPGAVECWCEMGSYPYTGLTSNDCYDANDAANPANTSYHTSDRGDGSYDYDCNGSTQKQYEGISGGCAWDIIDISCDSNGEGWESFVPACGSADLYIASCDAAYDYLCYLGCLLTANPVDCLINTCSADCGPEYSSFTQGCR
jgi:hypothetical protein